MKQIWIAIVVVPNDEIYRLKCPPWFYSRVDCTVRCFIVSLCDWPLQHVSFLLSTKSLYIKSYVLISEPCELDEYTFTRYHHVCLVEINGWIILTKIFYLGLSNV